MSRYGRSTETIKLEIAYAVGNDLDILDYLHRQADVRHA